MSLGNVFQLELAGACSSGRRLALRLGLAFLLGAPFALVQMPPRARAVGLVMLVVFVSFFGAAVALVRRRADGHWERLKLLPISRPMVWADTLLASVAQDLMQTLPILILFVAVNAQAPSPGLLVETFALLCVCVLVLNILGLTLAGAMRSNAEVHLAAALCVGLIAWLSGLFPVPDRVAAVQEPVSACSPVAWFAESLEGLVTQPPPSTRGAVAGGAFLALLAAGVAWRAAAGSCRRTKTVENTANQR